MKNYSQYITALSQNLANGRVNPSSFLEKAIILRATLIRDASNILPTQRELIAFQMEQLDRQYLDIQERARIKEYKALKAGKPAQNH